jgi:signal transduction histidine kinase
MRISRVWRVGVPRRTIRLRLTLWYSALFLVSGSALLAATYALVYRSFRGNPSATAACAAAGSHCHVISASQQSAVALADHAAALHELLTQSLFALAAMTVLSVALGWFAAGRALRPLRAITSAARQVSASSLSDRLALDGPGDELKELADTFDQLLARLETSFAGQRQFVANAAHELRTPLARQRVISQVALADPDASVDSLRAAHERVLAAGADQQQLIDALLELARGQAGLDSSEAFDLADVTRQVVAAHQREADDRAVTVKASLSSATASGSPRLAGQLAANLIANALRHNARGGRAEITTRTDNGQAILLVTNTGPTIPADDVERLFLPFRTRSADRTSERDRLGLGLAIVRAIADAHHATVIARPRPEGGLAILVAFPGELTSRAPTPASLPSQYRDEPFRRPSGEGGGSCVRPLPSQRQVPEGREPDRDQEPSAERGDHHAARRNAARVDSHEQVDAEDGNQVHRPDQDGRHPQVSRGPAFQAATRHRPAGLPLPAEAHQRADESREGGRRGKADQDPGPGAGHCPEGQDQPHSHGSEPRRQRPARRRARHPNHHRSEGLLCAEPAAVVPEHCPILFRFVTSAAGPRSARPIKID